MARVQLPVTSDRRQDATASDNVCAPLARTRYDLLSRLRGQVNPPDVRRPGRRRHQDGLAVARVDPPTLHVLGKGDDFAGVEVHDVEDEPLVAVVVVETERPLAVGQEVPAADVLLVPRDEMPAERPVQRRNREVELAAVRGREISETSI